MDVFREMDWFAYYRARFKVDELLERNPCNRCARGPNGADNCTHTPTSCWKFTKWFRQIWPVVTGKAASPVVETGEAAKVK